MISFPENSHAAGERDTFSGIYSSLINNSTHILGGGIPVGTVLLIREDRYTEYSKLLLKYFLSQGIASGHHILFASAEERPSNFIKGLPWIASSGSDGSEDAGDGGSGANRLAEMLEDKMTIAWRYKKMKRFESSVEDGGLVMHQGVERPFCQVFDLTKLIPQSSIESAPMTLVDASMWDDEIEDPYHKLLSIIRQVIDEKYFRASVSPPAGVERNIMRIGIHSIASSSWKSRTPHDLFRFFHALRGLLRYSYSAAVITIPAYIYDSPSFIRRVEHVSDAVIGLESFAGSFSHAAIYALTPSHVRTLKGSPETVNSVYSATYHGLFHVYKLPAINSLIAPSAKLSVLSGGGGNNLGFKLRRKKFSIETFHLPPEGGVNERRTKDGIKSDEKDVVDRSEW
ncbi:3576_t:CDS:2 [Acaulospora colombiana]|uniref:3576_t:CDS:1 n=1 Tax=Acaulospora colombiana TaxID=27376 RepID=A0ACA9KV53_9GLOM|nr:3576_t:CDS:2 [Acaulospora colombiana]